MIAGQVAVVTGASAGIGEAVARDLAAHGANVLLVARREDRLAAIVEGIGDNASALALDVSQPDAAGTMLAAANERFGRADILINNAGIFRTGPLEAFDLANLAPMIALNYEAAVRASYVFARAMKAAGSGNIVNISSIGANLTAPGGGVYGGLKRALEIFSDSLRIELAGTGVRVGIVAPGSTATSGWELSASSKATKLDISVLSPTLFMSSRRRRSIARSSSSCAMPVTRTSRFPSLKLAFHA